MLQQEESVVQLPRRLLAAREQLRGALGVERALPGKSPLVGNAVGAAVVQDDWARREQSCEHFA